MMRTLPTKNQTTFLSYLDVANRGKLERDWEQKNRVSISSNGLTCHAGSNLWIITVSSRVEMLLADRPLPSLAFWIGGSPKEGQNLEPPLTTCVAHWTWHWSNPDWSTRLTIDLTNQSVRVFF